MPDPIKVVVPVSGGKDSQVCLALAVREFGPGGVVGLFCDTQFEHPLTYQHVARMSELYGVPIVTVSGGSVIEKILKHKRLPSWKARFCTDELKMRVTRDWLRGLASLLGHGVEVWYGMRSGESHARRKKYGACLDSDLYAPHELFPGKYPKRLAKLGVMFRLPIVGWSEDEVLDFLGGDRNPLYSLGFDRVGCFPCLAGGKEWIDKAFSFDPFGEGQKRKVMWAASVVGRDVYGNQAEGQPPCAICSI